MTERLRRALAWALICISVLAVVAVAAWPAPRARPPYLDLLGTQHSWLSAMRPLADSLLREVPDSGIADISQPDLDIIVRFADSGVRP